MEWLQDNDIEGKILRLRTKRRSEVFIISDRYGGNESITENGTHYLFTEPSAFCLKTKSFYLTSMRISI